MYSNLTAKFERNSLFVRVNTAGSFNSSGTYRSTKISNGETKALERPENKRSNWIYIFGAPPLPQSKEEGVRARERRGDKNKKKRRDNHPRGAGEGKIATVDGTNT